MKTGDGKLILRRPTVFSELRHCNWLCVSKVNLCGICMLRVMASLNFYDRGTWGVGVKMVTLELSMDFVLAVYVKEIMENVCVVMWNL